MNVPDGWRAVSLGTVIRPETRREVPVRPLPYIGMEHVEPGRGRITATTDAATIRSSSPLVNAGDVLYGRLRPYLNKVAIAPQEAYASGEFIVFRSNDLIDAGFLKWRLTAEDFVRFATSLNAGDRPRVKWPQMADFPLPLPPLPEQRRIVEMVEDHMARLDAADASLASAERRISAQMASIRHMAWSHGDHVLLSEVAAIQGGIQKQGKRAPVMNAYPFLRVANVTAHGLDLGDVHQAELFEGELDRLRLATGDLLVVEGNGSASQIGRAALWDGSIPDCVHQNHLIRVRVDPSKMTPGYLELVWNSPAMRAQLTDVASSSSGLHTLSVRKLKALEVPCPPLSYQEQAMAQATALRENQQSLLRSLRKQAERSAALRRAVLAAAFSGQLTQNRRLEG